MFKISGIFAVTPPEPSHLFAGVARGHSRAKVPGRTAFSPGKPPPQGADYPFEVLETLGKLGPRG